MSSDQIQYQSPINSQTPITHDATLPDSVDVVIIGGGIAGISTAFELALKGTRVLVCEKGRVACEQSSRNWGWIRQTGRDADELPLMIESIEIWKSLAQKTGENELAFNQQGVLYLAGNEQEEAEHDEFMKLAREHNLDSVLLDKQQVKEKLPLARKPYLSGLWTPSDGRAEPWYAVPALARAASRKGALIKENCAVRTIETTNNKVSSVVTEHGEVKTNRVLLAAGAWTSQMARSLGLYLPQLAVKSCVARLQPEQELFSGNLADDKLALAQRMDGGYTMALSSYHQHTINADSFRYLWPFRQGAIKKFSATEFKFRQQPNYPGNWTLPKPGKNADAAVRDKISVYEKNRVLDPQVEPAVVERMLQRLNNQFDQCENARVTHAWAGMIETTPDFVPVLDRSQQTDGLFIATGFSGHGFGIGPAAGRVMADLIRGDAPGHDLQRFRLNRFTDGSKLQLGPI